MIYYTVGKTHDHRCHWVVPTQENAEALIGLCKTWDEAQALAGEYFIDGPIDSDDPIHEDIQHQLEIFKNELDAMAGREPKYQIGISLEIFTKLRRMRSLVIEKEWMNIYGGQIEQIAQRLMKEGFGYG